MECFLCGAEIERNDPRARRRVEVGTSNAIRLSKRGIGASLTTRHAMRTLCATCAAQHDQSAAQAGVAVLVVGAVLVLGLVLLVSLGALLGN